MNKYPYLKPYDSRLSSLANIQKSMAIAKEILGEPVHPPWNKIMELWENTRSSLSFFSPRTFIQIFDVATTNVIISHGLSLLGYEDNYLMVAEEAINLTHENQRALFSYQAAMVYKVFLEEPELIKDNGMVYSSIRSLKSRNGVYWLVNQTTIPAQYDGNGRMVRYLSSYRILKEYEGEPFQTAIYTDPKFPNAQKELRRRLDRIRLNMLGGLGFTRRQQEVIEYMGEGISSKDILETMGIGETGLKKHREKILAKGRNLFPVNEFKTALDVVIYLKKQSVI